MQAAIYVEGKTDRIALEALAARLGRDLEAEGVGIVVTGGAQNIRNVAAPDTSRRIGLCDKREERFFRRVLDEVYVCDADLEHELIRALGTDGVERVFEAHDDLDAFRKFQQQPAQQGRPHVAQLHRFMCSSRKTLYPERLVAALDLERVPPPLGGVLEASIVATGIEGTAPGLRLRQGLGSTAPLEGRAGSR